MNVNKLKSGDKVAIVSLSSGILGESFIKHELELGIKRIKEFGLEPVFMENSLKGLDFISNNPKARFDDLKQAFEDKSIKAIISAIGGVDSYKILPYIFNDEDFIQCVKDNPKIFMGYSDTTTTHLALNKIGLNTFYGPAFITDFAEFENDMLPYTKKSILYLFDAPQTYQLNSSDFWYEERTDFSPNAVGTERIKHAETKGYEVIKDGGNVTGTLFGGCIEVFSKLSNFYNDENNFECNEITKKFPIIPKNEELSNKILFLETSDEKISPEQYEKMIIHLKNYGLFNNIKGLLIGKPMDEAYYDQYKQILKKQLSEFDFSIIYNCNFGHSFPRAILPIGATAKIDTEKKSITFLNSTLI